MDDCDQLTRALPSAPDTRSKRSMTTPVDDLIANIRKLELELETEFAKQRAGLRYGLERGRIVFEREVIRRHHELRTNLARYILTARPLVALTAPVIYSLIIPFALIDLWVSIYQAICFRAYGIAQVRRGHYFVFDRSALAYLNFLQKVNCAYCSYCNGVVAYVREVAARTEQYWCPIKHAKRLLGAHPRYAAFEEYGDAEHYQTRVQELRKALRNDDEDAAAAPAIAVAPAINPPT
jgi:hypothetical protein